MMNASRRGGVHVDTAGNLIALETISPGETTGLSILISADDAATLVSDLLARPAVDDAYQQLRRHRSAEHSHATKGTPR
jgi:hypothetical protein